MTWVIDMNLWSNLSSYLRATKDSGLYFHFFGNFAFIRFCSMYNREPSRRFRHFDGVFFYTRLSFFLCSFSLKTIVAWLTWNMPNFIPWSVPFQYRIGHSILRFSIEFCKWTKHVFSKADNVLDNLTLIRISGSYNKNIPRTSAQKGNRNASDRAS